MVRRAEWRCSPDEPKGALGRLARGLWEIARAQEIPSALQTAQGLGCVSAFFVLPVAVGFGMLVLLDGGTPQGQVGWIAALLTAGATVGLMIWFDGRWYRPLESLERSLPSPLPEDTFPVGVAFRQRRATTGSDLAAASFTDGWLHVEGLRTSFSLRNGDGRAEWRGDALRIELPGWERIVLGPAPRASYFDPRRFGAAASTWMARSETPGGEPTLPSLGTHPSMRTGWAFLAWGGLLATIVALVFVYGATSVGSVQVAWLAFGLLGASVSGRGLFVRMGQREADRKAKALADPYGGSAE